MSERKSPAWRNFVQGGVAAMTGSAASHPLDLLKVRLQVNAGAGNGPLDIVRGIVREKGVKGLFSGLSAAMMRQAVYSSTRFGVYDWAKEQMEDARGAELSLVKKVGAGLLAGGVGAIIANPADVTMVRMQADGRLEAHLRRNYRNGWHGLKTIAREEGIAALWKGASPACLRAMIVTASQFAAYDQFKYVLVSSVGLQDGPMTHIASGFLAGLVSSVTSTPVDTIKTRMQNAAPGQYRGPLDCALQTVRQEGPMAVYKGFVPTVSRQLPYLIVMFMTLEQCKVFFKWLDSTSSSASLSK